MPYHKYVFDEKNKTFVGNFEEMYRNEDTENYDSWHQENLNNISKQLSLNILNQQKYGKILDIGCGKGAFTHLLKKADNDVTGIDISETAIKKASERYKEVNFKVLSTDELMKQNEHYELVVIMEVLSYLNNWQELIEYASSITKHLYISLYIPDTENIIGFVKSFKMLKNEINKWLDIKTAFLRNNESIYLLAAKK